MPPRDLDEIRWLKQRARDLRRGLADSSEPQRHNEVLSEEFCVMGDVIDWARFGSGREAEKSIAISSLVKE